MLKYLLLAGIISSAFSELIHGEKKTPNILGSPDQHASFSFIRPGLTQTSYSFNGPSSHQSFSSSIGNPHLAQQVLPNIAHALAYRNPGLGHIPLNQYQIPSPSPYPQGYQDQALDPAALLYLQQYRQNMESQLAQVLRGQLLQYSPQTPQQIQHNLLGVSYSSAPSVAHVNVSGNGYKFHF